MTDQQQAPLPKRRAGKNPGLIIIVLLVLVILGIGIVFLLSPDLFRSIVSDSGDQPVTVSEPVRSDAIEQPQPAAVIEDEAQETAAPDGGTDGIRVPADAPDKEADGGPGLPTIAPLDQSPGAGPDEAIASVDRAQRHCEQLSATVSTFFDTLDTRAYMQQFELEEPGRIYFPQLIQRLLDNPPVVTGETDDLFTILQNTAHFFRILGKKNIFVLKGILDREKDTFEQVLADFHTLTFAPDCLRDQFNLSIEAEPLYQYAGFFLNTMGGRLYLFRRDSMSRMVVSYYAILTIDQANREGRNKFGIELRPAVDSLVEEIETSTIDLRLRNRYLDTLYELQERYP